MLCQLGHRGVMELVLLTVLSWVSVWAEEKIIFDRHAVYWNSSNPKTTCLPSMPLKINLTSGQLSLEMWKELQFPTASNMLSDLFSLFTFYLFVY
ncbi:hypothetical protein ATANTOWER_001238 [Ataeniobius toweri]|uniref:Uncharacterized protein n=1 Tax=Ataeniobius toweri TaxID=208326 RepID=A0ABU7AKF1_9TELE|nr:hypothetical protein [Ataeniobius toweri]